MVQIGRRALSNYFKMIIGDRFYANIICFSKNEVSRTPMWTRDFLAPYYNIQIINRRLQPFLFLPCILTYYNIQIINRRLQHDDLLHRKVFYYNIQIINRRLQQYPLCPAHSRNYNIQIINRRLQPTPDAPDVLPYYNIQIINRRLQLYLRGYKPSHLTVRNFHSVLYYL